MYNIDVPYLTHLRMKAYITHMNTHLTSLLFHTSWYLFSAIVKKEKKRVKKDVVNFAL